jgi:serine/threonine-protein kinase
VITPLPAGTVFAGYQVDAVLARGGMGIVYLATESRPHRRVALKLIAPALAADPAYRERFLREVDALAALEHPNVVPMLAAGEWEGQLYLAMRYLDGPDLAEVVRTRGPLPPAEAITLLAPIADALDVAHARGLVHRDVTPANIRLDARGVPYLTDFGLTKRAATSGVTALTLGPMGTPAYMAPEQFVPADIAAVESPAQPPAPPARAPEPATADESGLAGRIDVYALACVLVTCLTGTPPYPRDTYEAALWAHVHADPPSLVERRPALPAAIDAVVARALAKDPAARHASAMALISAAGAALGLAAPGAGPFTTVGSTTTVAGPAATDSPPGDAPAARPPRRGGALVGVARAFGIVVLVGLAAATGVSAGLIVASASGPGGSPSPGTAERATARPSRSPVPPPTAKPTPTPTPTPRPTPTPTPTPRPTPRLGAPESVALLRAWIPFDVRDTCVSSGLRTHAEVAAVRCRAADLKDVRYALFSGTKAMDARWKAFVKDAAIRAGGRCDHGQEAVGPWADAGLFGIGGETRGSYACTVEKDGDARVDWTIVAAPIWSTIWRDDEDIARVYSTWLQGRLNPLGSPR